MKRIIWIASLVMGLGSILGCTTNEVTGRQQLMLIPSATVVAMGEKEFAETKEKARRFGKADTKKARVARITRITKALITQAIKLKPESAQWKWETVVINDSKTVNATCLPGGKITVYTGIVEATHATDDELAAVIGHEIAHALSEHGREKVSMALGMQAAIALAASTSQTAQNNELLMKQGGNLLVKLPNSRSAESEADHIGLRIAAMAGYNPMAGVSLWQKMGKLMKGGAPAEFQSTHPSNETRIADNGKWAEELMPVYESNKRNRPKY